MTENAALDGASPPDTDEHDGGWVAKTFGRELVGASPATTPGRAPRAPLPLSAGTNQ